MGTKVRKEHQCYPLPTRRNYNIYDHTCICMTTTEAELIHVLWGIIVLLCGCLGFFLISFFQGIKKTKDRLWKVVEDHHDYFERYCNELETGQAELEKQFEVCKTNGCLERQRLAEKYKEMYDTRYSVRDMFTQFRSWFDRDFMQRFIHVEDKVNEKNN